MSYDFERATSEWSHPPLDEYGYTSSLELLNYSDDDLRRRILDVEATRYGGWRNHENRWRESLGLDSTHGKTILDFGCGAGIEALQFARSGNDVIIADIVQANVQVTWRVLDLFGFNPVGRLLISDHDPFTAPTSADVFYAAGVIHHTPSDVEIMRWATAVAPEARLMLYSDRGWRTWIGEPVPTGRACEDPRFERFVRTFDAVGDYADFYDEDRIERRFGAWWDIDRFEYICDDDRYCTVTLKRK